MIDTIKVQIPLTEQQFIAICQKVAEADSEQWAKVNLKSGEIRLLRIQGLAETDQHSYHRDIRWDIPRHWVEGHTHITLELSLPKLFYGDNVRLLYNPLASLELLRTFLNHSFGFRTKRQLPAPSTWPVTRADVCYTWRFPSQELAQVFLDGLKRQRFPYKQPTIRPTSITFTGGPKSTYSAKFYLKLPEFLAHDAKAMRKARASEAEIRYCEHLATGLLRFEVTLRQKWLKRNEITTVADLVEPVRQTVFDEELVNALTPFFNPHLVMSCIFSLYLIGEANGPEIPRNANGEIPLRDGDYFSLPPGEYANGDRVYQHPGGGFRLEIIDNVPQKILREMLTKMVGEEAQLAIADRVKEKLAEIYKPATAANLTAFWLYVQKFGSDGAKQAYGRQPYDYKKRQLKKAGVSLLEQQENTIVLGKSFFSDFRLAIPSEHAGNLVDDERNSRNVLNLFEYRQSTQESS